MTARLLRTLLLNLNNHDSLCQDLTVPDGRDKVPEPEDKWENANPVRDRTNRKQLPIHQRKIWTLKEEDSQVEVSEREEALEVEEVSEVEEASEEENKNQIKTDNEKKDRRPYQ